MNTEKGRSCIVSEALSDDWHSWGCKHDYHPNLVKQKPLRHANAVIDGWTTTAGWYPVRGINHVSRPARSVRGIVEEK